MRLFGDEPVDDEDLPDDFLDIVAEVERADPLDPVEIVLDIDTAKVDPCPNCGEPVRRMGSVPIGGSGLDNHPSGPWWCSTCIQAKCNAAYAAVRPIDTTGAP